MTLLALELKPRRDATHHSPAEKRAGQTHDMAQRGISDPKELADGCGSFFGRQLSAPSEEGFWPTIKSRFTGVPHCGEDFGSSVRLWYKQDKERRNAPAGFRRARYTLPSGGRAFPPPCNQRRLTAETASSSRGTPPPHGAGIDCTLYLITMHGEEALAGDVTMQPPLGTVHRRLLTPPLVCGVKQGRERSHDPFAEASTKCYKCRSC